MIDQLNTYRLMCDDFDCDIEQIVHADDQHSAVEKSFFVINYGKLVCPKHKRY